MATARHCFIHILKFYVNKSISHYISFPLLIMKFPIAYYLLLLYITVMVKPLLPILSDACAHEFYEAEHITRYHAIYGSNHLEKELANAGAENNNGKNENNLNVDGQVAFHILTRECTFNFSILKSKIAYRIFKLSKLSPVLISNQGPPPKFCG